MVKMLSELYTGSLQDQMKFGGVFAKNQVLSGSQNFPDWNNKVLLILINGSEGESNIQHTHTLIFDNRNICFEVLGCYVLQIIVKSWQAKGKYTNIVPLKLNVVLNLGMDLKSDDTAQLLIILDRPLADNKH